MVLSGSQLSSVKTLYRSLVYRTLLENFEQTVELTIVFVQVLIVAIVDKSVIDLLHHHLVLLPDDPAVETDPAPRVLLPLDVLGLLLISHG